MSENWKVISQVGNRYVLGVESEYGEMPESLTQLDFGLMQTISVTEDEGLLEVSALNTAHTLATIEDGLYSGEIAISTQPTHPSIVNIFKAILGKLEVDVPSAGKYTISSEAITSDDLSYALKYKDEDSVWEVTGIHFHSATINFSKGEINSVDLTGVFKKKVKSVETITPETNIASTYVWLDTKMEFGANKLNLNSASVSLTWNHNPDDGRGIEDVSETERRLIQRVIRHNLGVSGNFESVLDDSVNTGYLAERTGADLKIIMVRGSGNSHVFTISGVKTGNRSEDKNTEDSVQVITADFTGIDLDLVGDTFTSS